ncbi:hypothetical protein [Streptomyces sp. TRM49041]|uniref:hypothetical protein n=1 Tax=Streptomyces sp. TRM49041 TaxID=2603216 RepID=UPI0021CC4F1B|nr:hypothetical protein [Streptomyces sp. TRM49041]
MDALEVLKHDHRMAERLFRDHHAAASGTRRRAVVEVTLAGPVAATYDRLRDRLQRRPRT